VTITSSGIITVAVFGVVFALVYVGVTLWRRRIPGLPSGPSTRAPIYLSRYAMALEYYGLRRREISSHVDALRGDLGAGGAADLDETLRRLGPPRTLAAEVTSGMLRPSFLRGTIWFGVGALVALAMSLLSIEAFLGGFEAVAEPGQQANWSALGFGVEATMGPDGQASSIEFGGASLIVLPLLAFVLGARLWRLLRWTGHRQRPL
jgi:hypothetical protein